MEAKVKARIMDSGKIRRTLLRMATEIAERNRELDNLVIIGIKTRGYYLGRRLADILKQNEGVDIPVNALDITPYRDDLNSNEKKQKLAKVDSELDLDGKDVVLVDDVIFTGRTSRAAMEAIFDLGRPKTIQLAVFIDRGHRELPIRPDYVGKNIPTSRNELIAVNLPEFDNRTNVEIHDSENYSNHGQ